MKKIKLTRCNCGRKILIYSYLVHKPNPNYTLKYKNSIKQFPYSLHLARCHNCNLETRYCKSKSLLKAIWDLTLIVNKTLT